MRCVKNLARLQRQVSGGSGLPCVFGPIAAGWSPFSMPSASRARSCKLILAAIRIQQVRGQKRVVLYAFERYIEAFQQSDRPFQIVNRLLDQSHSPALRAAQRPLSVGPPANFSRST